jgi:quercetin dioxygenase-like cupin family protein
MPSRLPEDAFSVSRCILNAALPRRIPCDDVILCDPDIEHWHGASPESRMTHVAITNYKGDTNVT